ncbi:hypothetical protein EST38_g13423 [Candolleomyces aberdarensis]|uniref:DUF6535 domain-containing protein n=1 Tax=Candolleomyces aberdarensis TaxID=2316362 RepID=A0A4Q2D294_9AGAR|nr:hypothetical protein EST38_g13423 [Candolleomyces aberdarensis]
MDRYRPEPRRKHALRLSEDEGGLMMNLLNPKKPEDDDGDHPMDSEFRRRARVWAFYLEDAEREARERVDIWRTGLDSLLIFVGLFAGIVSAFIIDARNDLQVDSEQNLLSEIRDTLRQPPIATVVHISASAKWINILWLLSLQITLFSAVMGVLAKEGLDVQAESWRVEFIITLALLLAQIASFLFSVGLLVRCFTDDRTVGYILLAFFMVGGAVYLAVSFLPVIVPSSPFDTPLASVFAGVKRGFRAWRSLGRMSRVDPWANRDDNQVLAQILYTKLIQSRKPEHIDEAAAEIALPSFRSKWIVYLCKKDTPHHLLSRFERCATTRTDNVTERNTTLRNHILAFLQFVNHFAEDLAHCTGHEERDALIEQYSVLIGTLRQFLEPTHPIHQRNNLHEALTPLLFGLKAQVLLLLQSIPEKYRLTADDIPPIFDFQPSDSEMLDHPWELAFQDIRSQDQFYFMFSACRGVLEGQKNLKTVSTTILSLRLAKEAGCLAMETECASQYAGAVRDQDRKIAESLIQRFLLKLFEAVGWDDMTSVELLTLSSPTAMGIDQGIPSISSGEWVLKILISTLTHPNREVRMQAISILVARQAQAKGLNYDLLTNVSIKSVSKMVVYEDEDHGREDAFNLLVKTVKDDPTKLSIVTSALIESCKTGFKQEPLQQMRVINFVKSLHNVPDGPFDPLIDWIIPEVVDLAWDSVEADVRQTAMNFVNDLWTKCELKFVPKIKHSITKVLSSGVDSRLEGKRYQLLTILSDLFKRGEAKDPLATAWGTKEFFQGVIAGLFEKIVKLAIHDNDCFVREEAKLLLEHLSRNGEPSVLLISLPSLILYIFVDPSIQLLEKLICWAGGDNDVNVRWSSLMLTSTICNRKELNVEMINTLKTAIASVKDSVVHEVSFMRTAWIMLLKDMIRLHSLFSDAVHIILELEAIDSDFEFLDLTRHQSEPGPKAATQTLRLKQDTINGTHILLRKESTSDSRIRATFIQLLSVLGRHEQCDFPDDVLERLALSVLTDCDQDVRMEALNAISILTHKNKDSVKGTINFGHVETGMNNSDWRVRQAWVRFAGTQVKDADCSFLSILLEKTTEDADDSVRREAIKALKLLIESENVGLREYIADKLGIVLSSSLAAPDSASRVVLALATITSNTTNLELDAAHILCQVQGAIWIELILLLGRIPECKSLAQRIIGAALSDRKICGKLPDPIGMKLPGALDSALDLESVAKPSLAARMAAIRFFSHLKGLQCSEDCKYDKGHNESLTKYLVDEKVISRLADIAIKGDNMDLRQRALRLLKQAFTAEDHLLQLRRSIKASLQKVIESSLKDHKSEFRANALDVVDNLTSGNGKGTTMLSPLFSRLSFDQTAVLIDGDENFHKSVENILFESLALPKELSMSDDAASSMASKLSRMLRNTSPFARATALEMLLILYKKHGHSKLLMVDYHSVIPEIIALALDDKNSEIWAPAIQLLVALSSPLPGGEERWGSIRTTSHDFVLLQIKIQVKKFMVLLESEDMRSPVVELLSLASLDAAVRQAISLRLATKIFTLGSTKLQEGHAELLMRLISDGRFQDEAADYMMLFLAHTLVPTNPEPEYSRETADLRN